MQSLVVSFSFSATKSGSHVQLKMRRKKSFSLIFFETKTSLMMFECHLQSIVCIRKMCISIDDILQALNCRCDSNNHVAIENKCCIEIFYTFLQQSLSRRHIFSRALSSAHGDVSFNLSPSSEYCIGILTNPYCQTPCKSN